MLPFSNRSGDYTYTKEAAAMTYSAALSYCINTYDGLTPTITDYYQMQKIMMVNTGPRKRQ
jgi:hypothetical protein